MRIAITSRSPFIAGAEISGERLAKGLQRAGHEIFMVIGAHGEAINRFRKNGLRCHHIGQAFTGDGFGLIYRRQRRKLEKFLHDEKIELIHSNDLPTHQMSSDAGRRLGIPRVCHHRWVFTSHKSIDWFNKFGADHHIFISQTTKNEMYSHSSFIQNEPASVIYNGLPIDAPPTAEEKTAAKKHLGLCLGKITIGFVGQINEHKGVEDLIKAWSLLRQWIPELESRFQLVIVGDDLQNQSRYRKNMESLASKLGLSILFAGYQENTKLWFRAFDITTVPSHREPFGLVTIEAMAEKNAVIGSRVGGIQEIISHEETGLLINPRDPSQLARSLQTVMLDPKERARLSENGRLRCEKHFSIDATVSNVCRVYADLLGR